MLLPPLFHRWENQSSKRQSQLFDVHTTQRWQSDPRELSIGSSFGCYVPGTEGFHGGQENMIPDCKELSIHLSVAFRPCTLFLVPAVLSLQYSLSLVDFSLPYRLRAGITFSSCFLLLGKYLEGISQMLMSRGSVT